MYGLADCNNFYASCERMFAPDLNGRPVVVLSNNDGCIIARSDKAKALGLKMGDAYFQQAAFLRQNNVAVFSSNLELYGDMSTRVMNTLKSYSPATEVYSIDESFMDFTGIDPATLRDFGLEIVQRVKKNTGIRSAWVSLRPKRWRRSPVSCASNIRSWRAAATCTARKI